MSNKRTRDADVVKQRKIMRTRFKKLVRSVILNQQWLSDTEEQGISMNVKKNVALLVRQKRKIGMLTVAEKALLRSQPWARSIEERKRLCLIIAGLTCFAKIPPKIRARMVPVLRFINLNADRVLIREGDMPITVYFILAGEVEMKKNVYNKSTRKMTMTSEAIFGPGDCIGEVEMCEDCPRMNTYVVTSNCEILTLSDHDYNRILGPFMKKQWSEKKEALRALDYFEFLNEDQKIRACKFGYLVQYEPLETIYYEDKGAVSYVHFLLSGECVILQCLHMKVMTDRGKSSFQLSDISKTESNMFENLSKIRPSMGPQQGTDGSFYDIRDILASSSDEDDEKDGKKKKDMRKMGLKEIEAFCGIGRNVSPGRVWHSSRKMHKLRKKTTGKRFIQRQAADAEEEAQSEAYEEQNLEEDYFEYFSDEYLEEEKVKDMDEPPEEVEDGEAEEQDVKIQLRRGPKRNTTFRSTITSSAGNDDESVSGSEYTARSSSSGLGRILAEIPAAQPDIMETHFIDVGSLTYGGIFGLGEKMEHRVIMARTVVQCLLLPRFWLMEKEQNPGNIWQRRRFYFECNIPTRDELFINFLKTRKWDKFRQKYVQSCLSSKNSTVNSTKPEDIPIMCRIVETSDE